MPEIPYEAGAHYIFNRGYNDFGNFYTINRIGAFSLYGQKPMYRSSPRPESGDYRKVSFLMSSEIFRFIKIPKTILKNFRNSSSKTPKTVSDTSPDEQSEGSGRTDFAALPKKWSVELFFKWIKQHLKIKKFWGTSENAIGIQIYCAIITYCLVAIVLSTKHCKSSASH